MGSQGSLCKHEALRSRSACRDRSPSRQNNWIQNNWVVPHSLWVAVEMPLLVGELSTQSLPFAWRFPKKGAGDAWQW